MNESDQDLDCYTIRFNVALEHYETPDATAKQTTIYFLKAVPYSVRSPFILFIQPTHNPPIPMPTRPFGQSPKFSPSFANLVANPLYSFG